ncbi:MAG: hypothetical protein KDD82_17760 [Planctomycetes bacterium]|nr:hypothetical protein [Planctomycetota bacterium]
MTRGTTGAIALWAAALTLAGCPADSGKDPGAAIGKLDTIKTSETLFRDDAEDPSEGDPGFAGGDSPDDEEWVDELLTADTIPELDAVQVDPDTGAPVLDPPAGEDEPWDGSAVRDDDEPMDERDPSEPAPAPKLSPEELKALAAKGILKHFPGITVYTKERRLEIEGSICLKRSPALELLACTRKGKTHESLLLLDLDPTDGPEQISLALILIGLTPTPQVNEFGEAIELDKGERVVVEVSWAAEDTPALDSSAPAAVDGRVTRRAEDLIWDKRRGAAMEPAGWVFTGSRKVMVPTPPEFKTEHEVFAASYTGNIAATFHDPDCVLDTPLIEGGDDTVYVPYEGRLPERGTKVIVHIRVQDPAASADPGEGTQPADAPPPEQPADPDEGK